MKKPTKMRVATAVALIVIPLIASCSDDDDDRDVDTNGEGPTLPDVSAATFVEGVDNPFFPLPVGARWAYEAETDEGTERIEIEVLDPAQVSKTVNGVVATVVEDRVSVDGEVIEYTHDWFAQDEDGNVWYLGEDTCEFEPGEYDPETFSFDDCEAPVGAWEWGVDGASPGILMPATPEVDGQPYYQEFYEGVAEDVGEVVEVGVSVSTPAGDFDDCIKTHDTSTLELDANEFKYYCRGVGTVLIEEPDEEITEELLTYEL